MLGGTATALHSIKPKLLNVPDSRKEFQVYTIKSAGRLIRVQQLQLYLARVLQTRRHLPC